MAMTIDFCNRKRIESANQISQYAKDAAFFLECGDVAKYENAMLQIRIVLSNLPNIACGGLAGTARLEGEVSQPANR